MSSLRDRIPVVLYLIYLIARYGLDGAQKRLDEENQRLTAELKGARDVAKQNEET